MKSIAIQNLVMKCFDKTPPSYSLTDNLICAMEYIAENLNSSRIVDPANSNNVISDSISNGRIRRFVNQLNSDLYKISRNEIYIK